MLDVVEQINHTKHTYAAGLFESYETIDKRALKKQQNTTPQTAKSSLRTAK
jgi:hypothetical protein